MGAVYRAVDARTGERVALKLLHAVTSPEVAYRFKREAVLLSELRHPAIVSYVEHGTTGTGQPYLAMEWLEGEDLAHRLAREPLDLARTLALLRRVAEALATAHQQGIVHRDIKPSNLLLRGGRPEDVVLVDFGLARQTVPTLVGVTGTGMVLGTPGYMAPEQASSQPEIPPAADIFSLGCVLYECLTGKPPFEAPHFAAALAKILFAEPAPLRSLRPGLPAGLQVLVDRMLVKDPRRRLPDAASLLEALSALESVPDLLLPRAVQEVGPPSLSDAQRLVSILLVSFQAGSPGEQEMARGLSLRDSLRTELTPYGAQVELLADGSLVATLVTERGTATDQAVLAARCALTFKERWPEASVVLATGLGVLSEHLPVGEAMDRAGRLLHQLEQLPGSSFVLLDELTAGLLGPGFLLSRSSEGAFLLRGEQLGADASRPLLGKPTPCVGREQELALLELTLTSCVEESAARALLVTAPAGVGKSRLRHEFLRRLERREQPPLVLLGRADPMSVGASYGLLGQALRRLCAVGEGDNLDARRSRLYQRVAQHLPEAQAQEIIEFLGELCAIPFPEEGSSRLRAARGDPRLMSAQVEGALRVFLEAECAHHPVLLVLEDLHWSDEFTVKLVDALLRELAEQPFMVLALAKPEAKDLFPGLWSRRLQELALHGLSRKASARLVREVLGPRIPEDVVQRVVEQADGNALFLEELIRMVAEGRGEESPQTVLAVLQARLARMEPGGRQVLLAASLFGRTFWAGGVKALLGAFEGGERLGLHLRLLVEREIIEPLPTSRFPSEVEYRFRHALVRDAAYGLMPDNHRPTGHRLVGTWLEQVGEADPLVLATHYQLGQEPERAAGFYTRAAEQLFERNDLQGAMWSVEAALACGVGGEASSRLRAIQSLVLFWMDDWAGAMELGLPALTGVRAGSPLWCRLISNLCIGIQAGNPEQADRLCELLLSTSPEPGAVAVYIEAVSLMASSFVWLGSRHKLEAMLERMMDVGADVFAHDALARGWMSCAKCSFLYFFEAQPWQAFTLAEQGMRDFREVGLERAASLMQTLSGLFSCVLGDVPGGLARLRESLAAGQRSEQHLTVYFAQYYLTQALANSSEPAHQQEAFIQIFDWMGRNFKSSPVGLAYAMLAKVILATRGDLHEAEAYARQACELLAPYKASSGFARVVLGDSLLAQGRAAEARQVVALGAGELEQMGSQGVYAVAVHLALAEACFAEGDGGAGEAALREALRCVRARASDIPDGALRESFLSQVPENARTLELARQRWGESGA
jgi:hypothetical protein